MVGHVAGPTQRERGEMLACAWGAWKAFDAMPDHLEGEGRSWQLVARRSFVVAPGRGSEEHGSHLLGAVGKACDVDW